MNKVTLRQGTPDDVASLAALRWAWIVEENETPGAVDRATFLREFVAWAEEHSATHRPFVAETEEQVVGMAWLALYPRVPSPRALTRITGDVQSVYVVPTLRGRGIGAQLISAVIDAATSLGVEIMVVHSSPGAVSAYKRAGFTSEEELRRMRIHPVR